METEGSVIKKTKDKSCLIRFLSLERQNCLGGGAGVGLKTYDFTDSINVFAGIFSQFLNYSSAALSFKPFDF